MGAGILGGSATAVQRYHEAYVQFLQTQVMVVKEYAHHVLSSEQVAMYHTCIENPGLCFVVTPVGTRGHAGGWATRRPMFFFLGFLGNESHAMLTRRGLTLPFVEP